MLSNVQGTSTTFTGKVDPKLKADLQSLEKTIIGLAKALKTAAKEEQKAGDSKAAQHFSKLATVFRNFVSDAKEAGKTLDKVSKEEEKLTEANKKYAASSKLVQQAWKVFSAELGKGVGTVGEAVKQTERYRVGLDKLEHDLKKVAVSARSFAESEKGAAELSKKAMMAIKELNTEAGFLAIRELELSGALRLTSQGFKIQNVEAYKTILNSKSLSLALRKYHGHLSEYQKAVNNSTNSHVKFREALTEINKAVGQNDFKFKQAYDRLKLVEAGISNLTLKTKRSYQFPKSGNKFH
jgi:cytochrome c556